jgi:hypothetical protein
VDARGAGAASREGTAAGSDAEEAVIEEDAAAVANPARPGGNRRRGGRKAAPPPRDYGQSFFDVLWSVIDETIRLKECLVYSYLPDWDSDPLSAGALWSFNYFFVNRNEKKLLFFACVGRRCVIWRCVW